MAHDSTRRMLITALAGLPLANVSLASADILARLAPTARRENRWSLKATRSGELLKRSPVG